MSALYSNCCAINEQTADGHTVGRCWFNLKNGVCPRHGDVSDVQKYYNETGKLTLEEDFRKTPKQGEKQ